MKNLIIIGAGNIGKIVYEYAKLTKHYQTEWNISGFLEFNTNLVAINTDNNRIIDTIDNYQIKDNDLFICSYANVEDRKRSVEIIKNRGGRFINIIHPTANILSTAVIGEGNIIGAFTTISVNAKIGNHVIIQDHCNIGHDCIIGDYSHIYVGNIICGVNTVEDCVTIYTGCTIYPKLKLETRSIIGAGSVVMRTVKECTTVMGNPAKKIE